MIILPGKFQKGHAAVRVLSSLPGVVAKEARPMKEWEVPKWMEAKARSLGKALAPDAAGRLLEIVGNDLRRLDNELEKLAVFVGEEKVITADAVDQATAWVRDFDPYELDNALEEGDLRKSLIVLYGRLNAGEKPEQVLAKLAGFVRNILAAKVRVAERSAGRKEIFKALLPSDLGELPRALRAQVRRVLRARGRPVDGRYRPAVGCADGDRRPHQIDGLGSPAGVRGVPLRVQPAQEKGGSYFAGFGAALAAWRLSLDLARAALLGWIVPFLTDLSMTA